MSTKLAEVIHHISTCTIKPLHILEESQKPCYLTPWDLQGLSVDYIQTGLLFTKPQNISIQAILDQLKYSLSSTLTLFYPLSGRLVTKKTVDPPSYCVYIDCKDGAGVEFIHAVAGKTTISDILKPIYVPSAFVDSLFALDRPINHDSHTLPLLSVQVTELVDGIFIGCSFNHIIGDRGSFWHFFNAWSQVSKSREHNMHCISCPPVTKRWFLNNEDHSISPPFSRPEEILERYIPQPYRERIFHFTSQSVAKLKAKANTDLSTNTISSFQAVAALVWRSVTRARGLLYNEISECVFPINDGKVTWYPGHEGGGSMDLEICLCSKSMSALESDEEFMAAVSPTVLTI